MQPDYHCKDPLVFTLGLERKQLCQSTHQPPSATHSTYSIFTLTSHCLYSSTPDSHSSSSPQPPVQDTHGQITLFPTSTTPHLSSFLFAYSLSFCTLGNDDQHLAIVAWHQYTPYTFISSFSFYFTNILHTFSCPFGATMPSIPTPFQTLLLPYTASRLCYRDSKMYLSSLLSRTAWYRSTLGINLIVCSLSHFACSLFW